MGTSSLADHYISRFMNEGRPFLMQLMEPFPCRIDESCYCSFNPNQTLQDYKGSHITELDYIESPVLFFDLVIQKNRLSLQMPALSIFITFVDRYELVEAGKQKPEAFQRSYEYQFRPSEIQVPLKLESYEVFSATVTRAIYEYHQSLIGAILNGKVVSIDEGFVLKISEQESKVIMDDKFLSMN
ncbi:hypothetical protein PP175_26470 (plasmid) [Aneurinibacillus sp. Ricciae_BoGa-3]|uniref:hypothetical protein n=1 Tax=Aneurinibacillus sp. Ricciae_BoGa-3 TaxID=3022697 RepID=UPI002340BD23|nr:hypothetical protein [Aneurinibacillus sp. Ricciae_BoGa-3]WCK57610.1 hypothetical protein PP175_26470 [Aneurinibacillus sp. Ricciae_BoGa-3]